jgi:hypothetical protein
LLTCADMRASHRHGFFVPYLRTLEGYDFLYVFSTLWYFSPL